MANQEHLDRMKNGVDVWNSWREKHTDAYIDLREADFSGANLKGIDLSRAKLNDANFSRADLSGAKLRSANLPGANLNGANLKGADLWAVHLEGADLTGADLSECPMHDSYIDRAKFIRANLSGAVLTGATLNDTDFSDADLSRTFFVGSFLIRACFQGALLNKANLREANLDSAIFSDADLREATLSGAFLRESNLSRADLSGAFLAHADLSEADLSESNLSNASLLGAHLNKANLSDCNLSEADLSEADLSEANLSRVNLSRANLSEANLNDANFFKADLSEANLSRALLVRTNLTNTMLQDCRVYGIAAWDVVLDEAKQFNLTVTPSNQPAITVDNLKVAQFIYLLLNNEEIRDIINTLTTKTVLILGRFTPERKVILDAIRDELRTQNYLPLLFDFDQPTSRDITETVTTLARLARFIIADLTDAKSIPQELAFIVPALPSVPVQPLLLSSQSEYSMFEHIARFPWVLPIYRYTDLQSLLISLKEEIIEPAEKKALEYEKH